MSTRSQICIKRDTPEFNQTGGIYIYKHHDGYPKGVLPILAPLVKDFHTNRGNDPEYLLAQIIRAFAYDDIKSEVESEPGVFPARATALGYTGWGLDTSEHGDIGYLYEVDSKAGKVYVNGVIHT